MLRKGSHLGVVSFAVLAVATSVFAQDPAPPAGAPPSGDAASAPSSAPTIEDYRALKKEVEELKQQVAAKDKQQIASGDKQPTTQPTAAGAVASAAAAKDGPPFAFYLGGNDEHTIKTLFAPRTEKEYFSPFDIMNPAHIRADMPMQIGQFEDMSLYVGFESVGRWQALQQENVYIKNVKQPGLDPGFQDPFGNLNFLASIPDKLDVYFDTYIASRPHSNTMYGHEGYILFKQLPAPLNTGLFADGFNYVNVKLGAFDIDFGDDNYRRSNNARVQRNPLIANPLIDPNVEEIGGEIYSIKGPVYWLFGLASGTTTEHFDYGSQPSFHGKLWGYPLPDLRTSISAYHVDLSGSADTSYLYTNGRSGGTLAAVFGGGDNPGQILPAAGKDVTAVQGDVTWNHWPFEIYSNVGWVQDSDINGPAAGTPAERWIYGTFEPVYHITPALYVAGRYSIAKATSVNGVPTNGWVDRAEVGGGYWVTNNLLGKVEYVYEKYNDFGTADGVVSGVDADRGPFFNGVVMEVSFSF
jgi:hypothetical protein